MPEEYVAQEASEESILSSSREKTAMLTESYFTLQVLFLYNAFLLQEATPKGLL